MRLLETLKTRKIAWAAAALAITGVVAGMVAKQEMAPLSTETTWTDHSETNMATGRKYTYRRLENSPTVFFIILQDSGQWVKIHPATASRVQPWLFSNYYGACPVQIRLEGEEAEGFGGMCPTNSQNSITLMPEKTADFIAFMQRGAGKKAYLSFQTYDGQVVEEVELPKKYPT